MVNSSPQKIGERIKQWREAKGWSQGQLAHYSGVNSSHISYIERALRQPKPDTLLKLASAFRRSYSDLVAGIAGYERTNPMDAEGGLVVEASEDPDIEDIHYNLLAMRDLKPDEVKRVRVVVKALLDELRRQQEEEDDAERRGTPTGQPGPKD